MRKHYEDVTEEKPPLFKKWSAWYGLVIFNLILLVFLFYIFGRIYQ